MTGPRAGPRVVAATVVAGLVVAGLVMAGLSACGGDDGAAQPDADVPSSITVTSRAFDEGDPVPRTFTCDADDVAPPLSWSGIPASVEALALVVDDPDAPNGTFTHWVVLDIGPQVMSSAESGVPEGGVQARNSAGNPAYTGPCPPDGIHRYRFTVYALSSPTGLEPGADLDAALTSIQEHAVAQGRLVATYERS